MYRSRNFSRRRRVLSGLTDTVGAPHHGRLVVSSNAAQPAVTSLAGAASFHFHRGHATRALRIGAIAAENGAAASTIVFSRRLERPDGTFDGVAVLRVRPSYLTSLYDEAVLAWAATWACAASMPTGTRPAWAAWPRIGIGRTPGRRRTRRPAPDCCRNPRGWSRGARSAPTRCWSSYRAVTRAFQRSARVAIGLLAIAALVGTLGAIMLLRRKQLSQEIRDAYRLATEGANEGFFFLRALYDKHGAIDDFLIEDLETIEQLHLLQLLGCKEVQGYYMCPPVPGPRMAELLRKRFMMTREGGLL